MRMVRVFLWMVPIVFLVASCAPKPRVSPAQAASTHYQLGRAYFDRGSYRASIPEFSKAAELVPANADYRNSLGMALMFTRNLNEAIKVLDETVRLDPKFSAAKNNLATAYMLNGDLEKARTIYLEVLDDPLYPTPHFAYFNLAKIYEQQGKVEKAIEEYKRALDIERNYVEAHNNLGFLYLQQGKPNLAIQEFAEAIRLNPKAGIYHRNLGIAYVQAGERQKAQKAFEKVLEVEPNGESAKYARKMLEELKQ